MGMAPRRLALVCPKGLTLESVNQRLLESPHSFLAVLSFGFGVRLTDFYAGL